jgi:hypothetical protein
VVGTGVVVVVVVDVVVGAGLVVGASVVVVGVAVVVDVVAPHRPSVSPWARCAGTACRSTQIVLPL